MRLLVFHGSSLAAIRTLNFLVLCLILFMIILNVYLVIVSIGDMTLP